MDNQDLMEQQLNQQQLHQQQLTQQQLHQQKLQQQQMQRKMQQQRNDLNNANAVKKAANIASKSGDPTAMAAGKAINAADKLTGGKASERLGKALTKANKMSGLKGRLMQKAINKVSGSEGEENKQKPPLFASLNTESAGKKTTISKETIESGDGSPQLFELPKLVKVGLIALVPILIVLISCCFIISSTTLFKVAVGLDNADSTSTAEADGKINEKVENLDNGEELKDEDILEDDTAYINNLNSSFATNKLQEANLVQTKKKNSLSSLDELEDYFPAIKDEAKKYDEKTVYKFYYKMHKLYMYYYENYNVQLDLSLLMSTLTLQSDDHYEIFKSNVDDEASQTVWEKFKSFFTSRDDFSYDKDWSGYVTTPTSGPHDMEVLAQHMVSRTSSGCAAPAKDGNCYSIDKDQYDEFLKEFIEKKYYSGGAINKFETGGKPGNSSTGSVGGNSMAEAMVNLANAEFENYDVSTTGKKYQEAYGLSRTDPWCAAFVWYVSANTVYEGKHLYPDIIPFKSAGTGTYIRLFNTSSEPNIKFYYNDNCKNLKGKNGNSTTYKPKPGDYIFIDWDASYFDITSDTQDHTGMVEKYEDGYIYTIEGNRGIDIGKVAKAKYAINDCRVIGFGSWY